MTEEESLKLHVAGATVRHKSPFENLVIPHDLVPLSREMFDHWVKPYYLKNLWTLDVSFAVACAEATPAVALRLLSEFNWRPRSVGAKIAAVCGFRELQPEISNLFLKSEVCFAGASYCLALVCFDNQAAAETLSQYLTYYLTRTDLWYEQGVAMAALKSMDGTLGSKRIERHGQAWRNFVTDKPEWDLSDYEQRFGKSMEAVGAIRQALAKES